MEEIEREIWARRPEHEVVPTLDRIATFVDMLGNPQRAYPVIHVTGTNGKTSTARMIETLLRERGLRTGRFTSPHLMTIRERIAIDGEPLSPEGFAAAHADVLPFVELADEKHEVPISSFELLTGMAYAAFADAPVDVAVVEVGLGGVWDATSVADGMVAVVTPIGIDHTRLLGDDIESIATEKAGIIKPGAVAVLAQQQLAAAEVLLRRIGETGATAAREGFEFGVLHRELGVGGQQLRLQGLHGVYDDVFLPLFGAHQAGNAACALAAVEAFAASPAGVTGGVNGFDPRQLDVELVRAAFAKAESPGRLEILRTGPTVLVDAAHNPAGMAATAVAVTEEFEFSELTGVVAVMGDKDVAGLLEELEPVLAQIVVTRNSSSRSMDLESLASLAEEIFGEDRVIAEPRLDDAIDRAIGLADEAGEHAGAGVLVTGSVVTAGDARLLLHGKPL